jgi:hypothetical protein
MIGIDSVFERDKQATLANRDSLFKKPNLLHWYKALYLDQFLNIDNIPNKMILEIGSGASPLKIFYSHVLTSDILPLDYLDFVFDCHEIDRQEGIYNLSLDVITLTNVLHHLKDPIEFLVKAHPKLKKKGKIVLTEPFFSSVSTVIYKYIHHEAVDCRIKEPRLEHTEGPLSSANQILPYLIFFRNDEWNRMLSKMYYFPVTNIRFFSCLSYFLTGGFSRNIPVPHSIYKSLFSVDLKLSRRFPKIFASFFTIELIKKD